jgi:glycosyltransferase involved in cell wall biosynthesis
MKYTLYIITCNRPAVLERALALAFAQTRPPAEVFVVDASDDWAQSRERLIARFAPANPNVRIVYEKAARRAIAAQRNQLLDQATADVIFYFDDDSLMFPDCAEQIMKVYEADTRRQVVSVGAALTPNLPDVPRAEGQVTSPSMPTLSRHLAAIGHRLFELESFWVPYDVDYPDHPIPAELKSLNIRRVRLLNGMRMTFRREPLVTTRFEDQLDAYGVPEDLDAVYRVSRHGAVLQAHDARMHHLVAKGGRPPHHLKGQITALSVIFLHALYSTDRRRSTRRLTWMFLRYTAINTAADLLRRRWSLPKVRSQLFGLTQLHRFAGMDEAMIRSTYPLAVRDLIASARN